MEYDCGASTIGAYIGDLRGLGTDPALEVAPKKITCVVVLVAVAVHVAGTPLGKQAPCCAHSTHRNCAQWTSGLSGLGVFRCIVLAGKNKYFEQKRSRFQ